MPLLWLWFWWVWKDDFLSFLMVCKHNVWWLVVFILFWLWYYKQKESLLRLDALTSSLPPSLFTHDLLVFIGFKFLLPSLTSPLVPNYSSISESTEWNLAILARQSEMENLKKQRIVHEMSPNVPQCLFDLTCAITCNGDGFPSFIDL